MSNCSAENPLTCRFHGIPGNSSVETFIELVEQRTPGSRVQLKKYGNVLDLELLFLPSERRSNGSGSQIMEALTLYADQNELVVKLEPDDSFGVPKKVLVKFYMKFGFTPKFTDFHNYRILEHMIRYPNVASGKY